MVDAAQGFDSLADRFRRLTPQIREIMAESVEDGAEVWVDVIENSGTDRQWKGRWWSDATQRYRTGTGRGRIDSGHMRDSMKGEVTKVTDTEVEGRIGWGNETEEYMIYQDVGFRHFITNEHIAGMQGRREAARQGWDSLLNGLARMVRSL